MRFRFTIRDLLWLTLVVGLAVGWWIEHHRFRQFLASNVVVKTSVVDGTSMSTVHDAAEVFDKGEWGQKTGD